MYFDEQMFIFFHCLLLLRIYLQLQGDEHLSFSGLKISIFFVVIFASFTESFTATVRLHMLVIILLYQLPP